jgi:transposase
MQDSERFTILEFQAQYQDEDTCLEEIFQNRYGALKACPDCGKQTNFSKVEGRKCWACQWCGYQLHPLAGTIFHKSNTPLIKWFFAIFLFANDKNGVSAKSLERKLGVTYKTAWRMAYQIRLLFDQANTKLSGTVEADETYVGGKRHGKRGRGADGKTAVVGMVEREKGRIVAQVVGDVKSSTIQPLIRANVRLGSTLMTDEFKSYRGITKPGYKHSTVNHGVKEYVRGNSHTNTIEGFWSQLKRSIHGTHHAVSPKHLQHYVDEFSWRYSNRKSPRALFFPMIELAGKQL